MNEKCSGQSKLSQVTYSNRTFLSVSVLESPGKPVAGSPSILKGCHNSLIEGYRRPTCYKSSKNAKDIDGVPVTGIPGVSRTVYCNLSLFWN